jgi:molybdopterin biosynthesis enzyme MoaB
MSVSFVRVSESSIASSSLAFVRKMSAIFGMPEEPQVIDEGFSAGNADIFRSILQMSI